MTRSDRFESTRLATIAELLRSSVKAPSPAELQRGLNALQARLARNRERPRAARRRTLLVAALATTLLLAALAPYLLLRSRGATQPVSVARIDGGKLSESGYLSEVGRSGIRLYFSEGSQFALTPGTRGRLLAVGAEGARFVLDHGAASFRITRNVERHWRIEAGPFLVTVQGTDFTVNWEPNSERFAVVLREGRVAVSGPVLGDALVLRPGQNLSVNLPRGETLITEGGERRSEPAEPSAAASASAAPVTSAAAPASAPAASTPSAPSASSRAGERRWRKALADGEWDRILAEVEREGVQASLRRLSSDDLFALADAARYRRRTDLARAALLAQRERFPSSPRTADAIFLLGRVEESRGDGKARAIERYDEYLARAPAGTYAAEALGRKMVLVKDARGPDAARVIADEYLRRFPKGSYAEAARALQRFP